MSITIDELAERVRSALAAEDLDRYRGLLAPDARWGPPDEPVGGCQDRNEIIAWYRAARDAGMRAALDEVVVGRDALLVGLTVFGRGGGGPERPGEPRWQVLAVRDGLIADIPGFDNRPDAADRAGLPG